MITSGPLFCRHSSSATSFQLNCNLLSVKFTAFAVQFYEFWQIVWPPTELKHRTVPSPHISLCPPLSASPLTPGPWQSDLCLWGFSVLAVFSSTLHEFIVLPFHGHSLFGWLLPIMVLSSEFNFIPLAWFVSPCFPQPPRSWSPPCRRVPCLSPPLQRETF